MRVQPFVCVLRAELIDVRLFIYLTRSTAAAL